MITVVVPVYNSENTLESLCRRVMEIFKQYKLDYEIILIDDNSNDNSYHVMQCLYHQYASIKCIKLRHNAGQQNALICGLRYGHGDYYVTIDDDLQNAPEDIMKLYNKLLDGYDIVYGVPDAKKHTKYRNFGSMVKELIFRLGLRKPKNIKVCSFRIMNKDIVKKILTDKGRFVYLSASALKYTKKIANIKVKHYERNYGTSNYTHKKLIKLLLNIMIYYSPLNFLKLFIKQESQYEVQEVLQ